MMLCERRETPQWISYQVFHDKLKNMVRKKNNNNKKKASNKMSVPISNNNEFYIRDKVFV